MVFPDLIRTSNESIKSALPPGLVAVFAGGTNGVGETTLKQFAKHAFQPTAYILGRSPEAGDRLTAECKAINPEGTFIFVQSDMSLMRNVDTICEDIASKEKCINILFLTIGTLQSGMGMLATISRGQEVSLIVPQKRKKACTMQLRSRYMHAAGSSQIYCL